MTHACGNLSIAVLFCRYKCSSRRHKNSSIRSISEDAPRFWNLSVYKPSALQKKPSASSEETFRFSEEAFRFAAHHKCISEILSKCRQHFFFDAYRMACSNQHMSHDDHSVCIEWAMIARRKTASPPEWVWARKHQCMMVFVWV